LFNHLTILAMVLSTATLGLQPERDSNRGPSSKSKASPTPARSGDSDPLSRGLVNDTSAIDDGVGFGKVYELPRRRGQPRRFARVSGALIAVFPLSTYESTEDGDVASVPAGTTYYLGSDWLRRLNAPVIRSDALGLLSAPSAVDLSTSGLVRSSVDGRAIAPVSIGDASTRMSIWTDEAYRRERLAVLLGPSTDKSPR